MLSLTGCIQNAAADPDAAAEFKDAALIDGPAPDRAVPAPDMASMPDAAPRDVCPEVCARCEAICLANGAVPPGLLSKLNLLQMNSRTAWKADDQILLNKLNLLQKRVDSLPK